MNTDYLNSVGKLLKKSDLPDDFAENDVNAQNLKIIRLI